MSSSTLGFTSVELPSSVPGIGYTIKHRNAVRQLIKYFCKKAIGKVDGNGVVISENIKKVYDDFNSLLNKIISLNNSK